MAVLLSGCGSKNADTQSSDTQSSESTKETTEEAKSQTEDFSKYVELGEYKGIELTKLSDEVSDEMVETKIQYNLNQTGEKEQIKTGTVKEGDTVNIAYEGKKDGVAFEGGTADSYDLTIGSGTFIEGFEEGLIGKSVGETVDLNLTFPEDYTSEELAGQDVVFTVTIHYICGDTITPELDDAWVAENSQNGSKTVAEYREEVRNSLEESLKAQNQSELENAILTVLVNTSKISEYPKERVDEYKNQVDDSLEQSAKAYGMTKEQLIKSSYQMELEQYEEYLEQLAKDAVAQEMIVNLIAQKENISYTQEEFDKKVEEIAGECGFTSADEFKEQFGQEKIDEEIPRALLYDKVIAFVAENAVYKDNEETGSENTASEGEDAGEASVGEGAEDK